MSGSLRRFRRNSRQSARYLFLADNRDSCELVLLVQMLPMCAHGQIFLIRGEETEATQSTVESVLEYLPPRCNITVVPTPAAAERAARAWLSEMHLGFESVNGIRSTEIHTETHMCFFTHTAQLGARITHDFQELAAHSASDFLA